MAIRLTAIHNLLKSLTEQDYKYLEMGMQIRRTLQEYIFLTKKTEEEILEEFEVPAKSAAGFLSGGYNYSIKDIAKIQAAIVTARMESAKTPVEFITVAQ